MLIPKKSLDDEPDHDSIVMSLDPGWGEAVHVLSVVPTVIWVVLGSGELDQV